MTGGPGGLYLCYFGLREPLVQTQVLPYVREIVSGGIRMSLLTFEADPKRRWSAAEIAEWRARLRGEGIEWHWLPYHKRPSLPATLYDIVRGAIRAARLVRSEGLDILHARSHVAAAMGVLARWLTGARLLFDFRGFLAEEYVESGNWQAGGVLYRMTKAAERWLIRSSDGFVVLTERARSRLFAQERKRPVAVIPCCVEESRFEHGDRDALRAEQGLTGRTVFVSVGTLGGFYMTEETAQLFAAAREVDPRAFLLVITKSAPARMDDELRRLGVRGEDYRVLESAPEDVSRYLQMADVAMCLIRPSEARQAASPTKFAEYLAAGLPVISTCGVGDLETEIAENRVGVLLRGVDRPAFADALRALDELRRDPATSARCVDLARRRYGLRSVAGERYRRLYRALLERP